jgi:hypothetical protein
MAGIKSGGLMTPTLKYINGVIPEPGQLATIDRARVEEAFVR